MDFSSRFEQQLWPCLEVTFEQQTWSLSLSDAAAPWPEAKTPFDLHHKLNFITSNEAGCCWIPMWWRDVPKPGSCFIAKENAEKWRFLERWRPICIPSRNARPLIVFVCAVRRRWLWLSCWNHNDTCAVRASLGNDMHVCIRQKTGDKEKLIAARWSQENQETEEATKRNHVLSWWVEAFTKAFNSLPPSLWPANQWHPHKLYLCALIACRHLGVLSWILIRHTDIYLSACSTKPPLPLPLMIPNQLPARGETCLFRCLSYIKTCIPAKA